MKSRSTPKLAINGLFLLVAVLGLCLISGCPGDESADMASQISGGGGRTPAAGGGGSAKKDEPAKEEEKPAEEGDAPAEGEAAAEGAEGEEVPAVDGTRVEVEIISLDVKAPFPQYEDEGYYDIFMEILAPKNPETDSTYGTSVWRFIARDKDGKEVLSFIKQIKLPDSKPGPLRFNGMYCMAAPVTFEFYITDKEAQQGGEAGDAGGAGGRGGGVGADRGIGGGAGGGGEEGGGEEGGGGGGEEPIDDGDE